MKKRLRRAIKSVMWISITFANDLDCLPPLPQQFLKAWCHLLTAMLLLSQPLRPFNASATNQDAANIHLERFVEALEKGDEEIVKRTRKAKLRDHEQCQASGLAWSILAHVTSNRIREDVEVIDSFQQHLERLVYLSQTMSFDSKLMFSSRAIVKPSPRTTLGPNNSSSLSKKSKILMR